MTIFKKNTQLQTPFEKIILSSSSPFIALRKAIIVQAIVDAINDCGLNTKRKKRKYEALRWIFGENKTFINTCIEGSLEPNFVFSYKQTIDSKDIRLGLAEAYFFKQNYNLAQDQVDILDPNNGIDPNQSVFWTVDSIIYNTYPEALLALIEKLKTII